MKFNKKIFIIAVAILGTIAVAAPKVLSLYSTPPCFSDVCVLHNYAYIGSSGTLEVEAGRLWLANTQVTTTGAELNALDGHTLIENLTATAVELNQLDGSTAVYTDFNKLHAVTSSAIELNKLDGTDAVMLDFNTLHDSVAEVEAINNKSFNTGDGGMVEVIFAETTSTADSSTDTGPVVVTAFTVDAADLHAGGVLSIDCWGTIAGGNTINQVELYIGDTAQVIMNAPDKTAGHYHVHFDIISSKSGESDAQILLGTILVTGLGTTIDADETDSTDFDIAQAVKVQVDAIDENDTITNKCCVFRLSP